MKTRKGRTVVVVGIVASLLMGVSAAPAAADYPARSMDYVLPFGPGGGTDLTVRLYKDKVEKLLGQPIVMTYKPGAGGVIAGRYVKESKPDGYTFLVISNTSLVTSMLARKADFTLDDFIPVCTLTLSPTIFAVNKDSPYKTMKDFAEAAKTKKMKYGITAPFSSSQLIVEAISRQEGFQAIPVPMGGGAKAMSAVLGGHVDMSVVAPTGIENQLRILAVNSEDRWEAHPEVPTLKELGYPSGPETHFSLYAPKGTPKEIVDKVYEAYKKVLEEDREEITKRAKGINQAARILGPEALGKMTQGTYVFFKEMLSKMGAPVN